MCVCFKGSSVHKKIEKKKKRNWKYECLFSLGKGHLFNFDSKNSINISLSGGLADSEPLVEFEDLNFHDEGVSRNDRFLCLKAKRINS